VDDILQELRACAQMMQGFKSPQHFKYNSSYDLLLEMGRPFERRLAHDYVRPKGLCFQNCFDIVSYGGANFHYCEGVARPPDSCGLLFDHAWLVNDDGLVIDPTWHDPSYSNTLYYGIPFDPEYLVERALKTKVYGVLNHVDFLRDGLPPEALAELLVDYCL
jgi:hypothetical protein